MEHNWSGFGSKVRSMACGVGRYKQVGGLACSHYPLESIRNHSAAEEPPPPQEDGVSTLSPAKPKAGEIYIHKNLNSANGNTTANAWCVKGLALTCLFSISIWVTNT